MTDSTLAPGNRIVWADFLRLFAILMVITSHCTDPFTVSGLPEYKLWGAIYGSFARSSVPLFVMLTGMLLLPIKGGMVSFYKKRIIRVAVPMLIWSTAYNMFPWISTTMGMGTNVLDIMFVPFGAEQTTSIAGCATNVALSPFDFSIYAIPMWYLYMLIGLYLFMPVFSAWIEKSSVKEKKIYLGIWCATLCLPYVYNYITVKLLGACDWNSFGMLYYFAGFSGYLLLGHYFKNGLKISKFNTRLLSLALIAVGYAITFVGFRATTAVGDYNSSWELFYTFCSPNVMLITVGLFLLVQTLTIKSIKAQTMLASLTKCGMGIYMLHYFFVGLAVWSAGFLGIPVPLQVPTAAIVVLVLCWALTSIFYKLTPRAARWIMG